MPTQTIEVHGTIAIADIVKFAYFNILRRVWPLLPVAALVPPINLLLYAAGDLYRDAANNLAPLPGLVLFWLVIPYVSARRQASTRGFLREPMTYSFSADGVHMAGPSFSTSFAWSLVKEVRETRSLVILYEAANVGRIVPKHFFPALQDLAVCKALISTCIAPKAIKPPGVVGRWC